MVEDPTYHLLAEQETRKLIPVNLIEFYPALSSLRLSHFYQEPFILFTFYTSTGAIRTCSCTSVSCRCISEVASSLVPVTRLTFMALCKRRALDTPFLSSSSVIYA